MDRRLQRFGSQVGFLEECISRLSDDDGADLILAIESLHRETLLLRAEIRDYLAGGKRSQAEMAEYVEESWRELQDSLGELKENLQLEEPSSKPAGPSPSSEDEDEDEDWSWSEEECVDDGDDLNASEIHPPRVGPKR
jgi:hypothetical protein